MSGKPPCNKYAFAVTTLIIWVVTALLSVSPVPADQQTKTSLDRFESDIISFEKHDQKQPVAPGGTVFVGSSSIARWDDLEKRFSEFKAINRGFGGSTIPEIDHYIDRVVTNYKPAKVVFYAGTNDIADGVAGQQVYASFVKFAGDLRKRLPHAQLYFISMSMAPSRVKWAKEYEIGNSLIEQYAKSTKGVHYIDVTPVMRDAKGDLRQDFFLKEDELHMTPSGYDAWTPLIVGALRNKP